MANEELITKYSADERDYVQGTEKSIGATKRFARELAAQAAMEDRISKRLRQSRRLERMDRVRRGRAWQSFTKPFKGMKVSTPDLGDFANLGRMAIGTMAGVGAAAGAAGITAMKKAADFDALVKSLEAVEGQGKASKAILEELRDLAKLPGLDFSDAIQSYANLRRNGLDRAFSQSLIREIGNQNAASGGGIAEFGQLMRAISQIATKPFLQGDELIQLTEGGLPAYAMIKQIFGTTDTEELKRQGIDSRKVLEGLVATLSKMPRVAGGAKNDFENLGEAINQAMVNAGGALNTAFLPKIRELSDSLEELSDGGVIKRAFEDIAEMLGGIGGDSSVEDVLLGILVESKTIAYATSQLWYNLEGLKAHFDVFMQARDWVTPGGIAEKIVNAIGLGQPSESAAPNLAEMRQKFIDEMEGEKARLAQKRAKGKKAIEGTSPTPSGSSNPTTILERASFETAQNTARMVQLQKKQNDISSSIIGGTSRPGITPVEMAGLGRSRKRLPDIIKLLTTAVYQEGYNAAMGVQFDMYRRGQFSR